MAWRRDASARTFRVSALRVIDFGSRIYTKSSDIPADIPGLGGLRTLGENREPPPVKRNERRARENHTVRKSRIRERTL